MTKYKTRVIDGEVYNEISCWQCRRIIFTEEIAAICPCGCKTHIDDQVLPEDGRSYVVTDESWPESERRRGHP